MGRAGARRRKRPDAFRSADYLAKAVGYAAKDVGADARGVEEGDGVGQMARTDHHPRLRAAADLFGMYLRETGAGAESIRRMSKAWGWRGNVSRRARAWAELSPTVARARRIAYVRHVAATEDLPTITWTPGAWAEPSGEWAELLARGRKWRELAGNSPLTVQNTF